MDCLLVDCNRLQSPGQSACVNIGAYSLSAGTSDATCRIRPVITAATPLDLSAHPVVTLARNHDRAQHRDFVLVSDLLEYTRVYFWTLNRCVETSSS